MPTTINGDSFQPRSPDNFLVPTHPRPVFRYYACFGNGGEDTWPSYPYIVETTLDQLVLLPDTREPAWPDAIGFEQTPNKALALACQHAVENGWDGWFPHPVGVHPDLISHDQPFHKQITISHSIARQPLHILTNPDPDQLELDADAYCVDHHYINQENLNLTLKTPNSALILLTAIATVRASQAKQSQPLKVALITHDFGTTTLLAYTHDDLHTQIAAYVSKNWKSLYDFRPLEMPSDPAKATELYFDVMADHPRSPETLGFSQARLP